LDWCTISEAGVSTPTPFLGTVKGEAADADVYIAKYLPKMVKFIEKHHKKDETIVWIDLASCHYAKKTLEWLEQKSFKIVLKADNPLKICLRPDPLKIFGLSWLMHRGGLAIVAMRQLPWEYEDF
jgi:hypothetical protein